MKKVLVSLLLLMIISSSIIANPLTQKDIAYITKEKKGKRLLPEDIKKFKPLLTETGEAVFVTKKLTWNRQDKEDLLTLMYVLDAPSLFQITSIARFDTDNKVADVAWELFEGERYDHKNAGKQVATELLAVDQYPMEVAASLWGYQSKLTLAQLTQLFAAATAKSSATESFFAPDAFKLAVQLATKGHAKKEVLALLEKTMDIGNIRISSQAVAAIKQIR